MIHGNPSAITIRWSRQTISCHIISYHSHALPNKSWKPLPFGGYLSTGVSEPDTRFTLANPPVAECSLVESTGSTTWRGIPPPSGVRRKAQWKNGRQTDWLLPATLMRPTPYSRLRTDEQNSPLCSVYLTRTPSLIVMVINMDNNQNGLTPLLQSNPITSYLGIVGTRQCQWSGVIPHHVVFQLRRQTVGLSLVAHCLRVRNTFRRHRHL